MKRTLITPPVYYPVVLDQVKRHLRLLDLTDQDAQLQSLIGSATSEAERYLRRRLITQTWNLFLDAWPWGDILLPFGKLSSVTHIKYTDTAGDQTTWYDSSETTYVSIDTDSELGRIKLKHGQSYPSAALDPDNPIEIQFICGYGAHAVQTITGASDASPIVITITGHGYTTGDIVYLYGATGQTAANGQWIITKIGDNTFSLNGSISAGAAGTDGSCVQQAVEPDIIQAILLMIGDAYENREDKIVMPGLVVHDLQAARNKMFRHRLWERASG